MSQTLRDRLAVFFSSPKNTWAVGLALLCFEVLLNAAVIWRVKYTEIDWEAYMDEVKGAIHGERDYTKLGGATGPLVYPAGFVYLFGLLYYATDEGSNVFRAQLIFAGIYLLNLAIVVSIYAKSKSIPPYVLLWMTFTSYRVHSIFVLRLFNDPTAMLLFYLAVLLFMNLHWTLGCVVYSIAISVKMNILLSLPGLLFLLVKHKGAWGALARVLLGLAVQIALGLPFLLSFPESYLSRAFEFSRQFFFKWTVNWRFLGEEIFLDRQFHALLLGLHFSALFLFALWKWTRPEGGLRRFFFQSLSTLLHPLRQVKTSASTPSWIAFVLFSSNFIGMVFARSLHYQFYVWYYHTLPLLLWHTPLPVIARFAILACVEVCWNTYPSTSLSSGLLLGCHLVTLFALLAAKTRSHFVFGSEEKKSA